VALLLQLGSQKQSILNSNINFEIAHHNIANIIIYPKVIIIYFKIVHEIKSFKLEEYTYGKYNTSKLFNMQNENQSFKNYI
jgi:hypothetical protein